MTYSLKFLRQATSEWRALDRSIRNQAQRKLEKRLQNPHVPADLLSGELAGLYRLKFRKSGIRIIYKVVDDRLLVLVVAIGKRENFDAYQTAVVRLALLKGEGD
ncbi:MAG: type II toxin-antitoxin system RelE/ParE family toxin [Actinobacteria bacterium]|nr:type II toxin-antitoxin system RelE/ParE family toxin [Actinomycetota bacterium]